MQILFQNCTENVELKSFQKRFFCFIVYKKWFCFWRVFSILEWFCVKRVECSITPGRVFLNLSCFSNWVRHFHTYQYNKSSVEKPKLFLYVGTVVKVGVNAALVVVFVEATCFFPCSCCWHNVTNPFSKNNRFVSRVSRQHRAV